MAAIADAPESLSLGDKSEVGKKAPHWQPYRGSEIMGPSNDAEGSQNESGNGSPPEKILRRFQVAWKARRIFAQRLSTGSGGLQPPLANTLRRCIPEAIARVAFGRSINGGLSPPLPAGPCNNPPCHRNDRNEPYFAPGAFRSSATPVFRENTCWISSKSRARSKIARSSIKPM